MKIYFELILKFLIPSLMIILAICHSNCQKVINLELNNLNIEFQTYGAPNANGYYIKQSSLTSKRLKANSFSNNSYCPNLASDEYFTAGGYSNTVFGGDSPGVANYGHVSTSILWDTLIKASDFPIQLECYFFMRNSDPNYNEGYFWLGNYFHPYFNPGCSTLPNAEVQEGYLIGGTPSIAVINKSNPWNVSSTRLLTNNISIGFGKWNNYKVILDIDCNSRIIIKEFRLNNINQLRSGEIISVSNDLSLNSLQLGICVDDLAKDFSVTFMARDTTKLKTKICPGNIFTFHGIQYNQPGIYHQSLPNQYNCDSIIEINLQYFDVSSSHVNLSLCDGPTVEYNGVNYDAPGIYTQTSTDLNGCEVTETITVTACSNKCTTKDTTLCYLNEPYPSGEFGISRVWQSLTSTAVYQSPLLADMDNDCIPDIVASSLAGFVNNPRVTSGISIINTTDGTLKQSISTAYFAWGGPTSYVIGDINRDGLPEIILAAANTPLNPINQRGRLICYDTAGNILWISDQSYGNNTFGDEYGGTPGLADFNQDGFAEVYIYNEIFNAETGVKVADGGNNGTGTVSSIFNNYAYGTSIAAHLDDNANTLELAAGYTIYQVAINNLNGMNGNSMVATNLLIDNQFRDGFTSIGDINLDKKLDVIVSSSGSASSSKLYVYTWQSGGTVLLASTAMPTSNAGCCPNQVGPVFIGDLDGSGKPSIGVTRPYNLLAYEYDGSATLRPKWRLSTNDESGATGMTMFDFNQDGKQEIVYRDETNLRIMDGSKNPPIDLASFACNSGTGLEYPIIGDIDYSGESKLCVTCGQNSNSTGRIHVFASPDGYPNWAPSRGIWNQYNYHVFNIADDLTVPRIQASNASASRGRFNNFLVQASLLDSTGAFLQSVPNLYGFLKCIQYDEWKGEYSVQFAVGNATNASASFTGLLQVSFFHGNPKTSNKKIGSFSFSTLLRPGDIASNIGYSFNYEELDSLYMLVHADNQGSFSTDYLSPECDYSDNLTFSTEFLTIETTEATICQGDSIRFQTEYYTVPGEYISTKAGFGGCDTINRLILEVQTPSFTGVVYDICQGDSVLIGSKYFYSDTIVTQALLTSFGCDSLVEHTINLFLPLQLNDVLTSCQGDSLFFLNTWYIENDVVFDTLPTLPCQTYRTTELLFFPSYQYNDSYVMCPGDTLALHGLTIWESGMYQKLLTTVAGCDSLFNLKVIYLPDPEKPEFTPDCQSLTYLASISDTSTYSIIWSNGSRDLSTIFDDNQRISIEYLNETLECELRSEYSLPKIPDNAPEIAFQDTVIYPGKPLSYNLGLPPDQWDVLWAPSKLFACDTCFSPTLITRENQDIFIFLQHISGCSYEYDFSIEVDPNQDIRIPNIFAPDAPGPNQQWTWYIPECFMVKEVNVYDRWGNLVFALVNPEIVTWDGTFSGKAVIDGVYTFTCIYMLPDGSITKKYGDVTIVHTR